MNWILRLGMKGFMFFATLLLFCSCSGQIPTTASGRISPKTTFTKKEYTKDLKQLVRIIKDTHPAYQDHASDEDLDEDFEVINELFLSDSLTIGKFIWLCRGIVASIGCGHSTVPTIGDRIEMADSILFPLDVVFVDEKLYVKNALINNQQVIAGDEILSINGTSVRSQGHYQPGLYDSIKGRISSDGFNESNLKEMVNSDMMLYIAYELDFPSEYEIDIRGKGKIKLKQLDSYEPEKAEVKNLRYRFDAERNTAILSIRSFYYYNDNFPEFKAFIDESFAKMQVDKAENLIIDLRDNGGGDPFCGAYLLQHITQKPFQYYPKGGIRVYQDLEKFLKPAENRFHKKPIVLINGKCFSTTGAVTALMKTHDMVTMIGQDTGATYACNASVQSHRLINTGISAFIASRSYAAAVDDLPRYEGVHPDIPTESTIKDILQDRDVEMERAFQFIKEE